MTDSHTSLNVQTPFQERPLTTTVPTNKKLFLSADQPIAHLLARRSELVMQASAIGTFQILIKY